jgi:hypothetical protein
MYKIVILTGLLLTSACADRKDPFVIGMYGTDAPIALKLQKAGFNAIQPVGSKPSDISKTSKAINAKGMTTLLPNWIRGDLPASEFPGSTLYLFDEPDVHGLTREKMAELETDARKWSPEITTAFSLGSGHAAKDFLGVGDILMPIRYPVPHWPLESVGEHVKATKAVAGKRKVWAVLQAMSWEDFPEFIVKGPKTGRFPTWIELRFMSYDAILAGAEGLWYYVYNAKGKSLGDKPDELQRLTAVTKEIRAMAPIFTQGKEMPLAFQITEGLAAKMWTYRGRDYLVFINRTKGLMWKMPEEVLTPEWRLLFDTRRDPRERLIAREGSYYLDTYRVMVLESRLSLKRLFGRGD